MFRPMLGLSEPDLERELLRKGVGALEAGRVVCRDCGRTPLTGERVHVYDDEARVCDLCRPRLRQAPERTEQVRHTEGGHAVRVKVRIAA